MINPNHLLSKVIRPVLSAMGGKFDNPSAERLMLGTAAQESNCGQFLTQKGSGPARGIFQMETWVAMDHAKFMRKHRPQWAIAVKHASGIDPGRLNDAEMQAQLCGNLLFAAAMCRVHYYRKPESLPASDDDQELGEYWKDYYNTEQGHGTADQFVDNLRRVEEMVDV